MKRIFTSFFLCSLFPFILACSESSSKNTTLNCDNQSQIINTEAYNNLNTTNYMITSVSLNENCLDITISSSGCSGSTWEMNLFSTNNLPDSFPLQRNLKLQLINNEACAAVFSKTVSFDLTPLHIAGQDQITLNLEGWGEQIVYQY
ncbi:hypothetical protein [Flavobacterium sangjuense]|uniref:Lipoprotein n=1 Tax=Flavobacterium sangjuense TaxID=2518177 RepID=A0A4P7PRC5_9FLAO|nr:hypothetical protein [Flavobacterium sangjuense]QBZ97447.1 hypothetical protein GS03_00937 [Flavobacterium sangjuense]